MLQGFSSLGLWAMSGFGLRTPRTSDGKQLLRQTVLEAGGGMSQTQGKEIAVVKEAPSGQRLRQVWWAYWAEHSDSA